MDWPDVAAFALLVILALGLAYLNRDKF